MAAEASAIGPVHSPTHRRMVNCQATAPAQMEMARVAAPSHARQAAASRSRTMARRPSTNSTAAPKCRRRSTMGLLQPGLIAGRQLVGGNVLAQLQDADIGGDGPAVGWRHAVGEAVHDAEAVADGVHDLAVGEGLLVGLYEALGLGEAARRDHAGAAPRRVVAHHAIDAVALAPALQ